jgi:hypothetical protein
MMNSEATVHDLNDDCLGVLFRSIEPQSRFVQYSNKYRSFAHILILFSFKSGLEAKFIAALPPKIRAAKQS